jgi:RNA polymerase sigma-70 factor (ECF subfamily)
MQKITAEDGAIISRYQRGSKAAFNELVARHRQRAYHYASRLTNNPDEAADIVAETLIRVYRSLEGFKGESSFTTWLYRIEKNCFLDLRKKANARPCVSLDDCVQGDEHQFGMQVTDDHDSAHECVEKRERLGAIEAAMKHLPEHQRSILMMYHAQSMSYEDIASTLGLPIGTVKSRLNRARLSLRNGLRPCRNLFVVTKSRRPVIINA